MTSLAGVSSPPLQYPLSTSGRDVKRYADSLVCTSEAAPTGTNPDRLVLYFRPRGGKTAPYSTVPDRKRAIPVIPSKFALYRLLHTFRESLTDSTFKCNVALPISDSTLQPLDNLATYAEDEAFADPLKWKGGSWILALTTGINIIRSGDNMAPTQLEILDSNILPLGTYDLEVDEQWAGFDSIQQDPDIRGFGTLASPIFLCKHFPCSESGERANEAPDITADPTSEGRGRIQFLYRPTTDDEDLT